MVSPLSGTLPFTEWDSSVGQSLLRLLHSVLKPLIRGVDPEHPSLRSTVLGVPSEKGVRRRRETDESTDRIDFPAPSLLGC